MGKLVDNYFQLYFQYIFHNINMTAGRMQIHFLFVHRNIHSRSAAKVTIQTMTEQGGCFTVFTQLHSADIQRI